MILSGKSHNPVKLENPPVARLSLHSTTAKGDEMSYKLIHGNDYPNTNIATEIDPVFDLGKQVRKLMQWFRRSQQQQQTAHLNRNRADQQAPSPGSIDALSTTEKQHLGLYTKV